MISDAIGQYKSGVSDWRDLEIGDVWDVGWKGNNWCACRVSREASAPLIRIDCYELSYN